MESTVAPELGVAGFEGSRDQEGQQAPTLMYHPLAQPWAARPPRDHHPQRGHAATTRYAPSPEERSNP